MIKVRIHYRVNGTDDSIDITGDDVADCREQWENHADGKPFTDMYSEILEDSQN